MSQMLLALNYIHSHGMVHRDLKLENFLYDKKGSNHLKLIDFGFSKVWNPNIKMHMCIGTPSYVAPEVLNEEYTSKCDMWSLGVILFILLSGYMPFSGSEATQTENIMKGRYFIKPQVWQNVPQDAIQLTQSLLQVNPDKRPTAYEALQHVWIANRVQRAKSDIDPGVVEALRQFATTSKFRRCCMEMMAWSLSNEERAKVREHFLAMDINREGTITLAELRRVMVDKYQITDDETLRIFKALDSNNDEEIHYSDFLAAMVSTRIALHDDLLRAAFRKFDTDSSGYITVENLRDVLGDTFEGEEVENLLNEADQLQDQRISYAEFVSYLRGTPIESHMDAASRLIDSLLKVGRRPSFTCDMGWQLHPKDGCLSSPARLFRDKFTTSEGRGSRAASKESIDSEKGVLAFLSEGRSGGTPPLDGLSCLKLDDAPRISERETSLADEAASSTSPNPTCCVGCWDIFRLLAKRSQNE
eukprot:gnl/TRDRNA2_/TRDRNA2_157665_c2_seq1.p1 gnl/TRDRNA2_/TRDRNA2_157665_c2~~gnl/TRDRNA2_/TRDRNA2_157665_c2_seq1.p1  ORF type:complete len:473 (-),score=88.57 gnl/TRDRNA2_/TRDRNA2_157665_c2_seq1:51-1469(-)